MLSVHGMPSMCAMGVAGMPRSRIGRGVTLALRGRWLVIVSRWRCVAMRGVILRHRLAGERGSRGQGCKTVSRTKDRATVWHVMER
jgi:hypothetical protein